MGKWVLLLFYKFVTNEAYLIWHHSTMPRDYPNHPNISWITLPYWLAGNTNVKIIFWKRDITKAIFPLFFAKHDVMLWASQDHIHKM